MSITLYPYKTYKPQRTNAGKPVFMLGKHEKLKREASCFLWSKFKLVSEFEKTIGIEYCPVKFDVIAKTEDDKIIAVECGSLGNQDKVRRVNILIGTGIIDRLYILPYGAKEPFLYRADMILCDRCGNIIGNVSE